MQGTQTGDQRDASECITQNGCIRANIQGKKSILVGHTTFYRLSVFFSREFYEIGGESATGKFTIYDIAFGNQMCAITITSQIDSVVPCFIKLTYVN